MARIDFVARIAAQVDLHPNPLLLLQQRKIRAWYLMRAARYIDLSKYQEVESFTFLFPSSGALGEQVDLVK